MSLTFKQSEALESLLKERGYTKYIQHYKNEDFLYWKDFDRDKLGRDGFGCGVAFYDWSKYPQHKGEPFSISYEFLLGNTDKIGRMDLSISDNELTIEKFETFCKELYEFYKNNQLSK